MFRSFCFFVSLVVALGSAGCGITPVSGQSAVDYVGDAGPSSGDAGPVAVVDPQAVAPSSDEHVSREIEHTDSVVRADAVAPAVLPDAPSIERVDAPVRADAVTPPVLPNAPTIDGAAH